MDSGCKMTLLKLTNRVFLAALLSMPVTAVATPSSRISDQLSPPAGAPSMLEFGASLLLVIAAIFVVGWFYARMQGMRGGSSNVFNIIASQSLGSKERIILVEVGNKQIVVGITSASMQALHVFDEAVETANFPTNKSAFAERLMTALRVARK